MRINKFLSFKGFCSRREADRWIAEGKVFLNGRVAVLGDQVGEADVVEVGGQTLHGAASANTFQRVIVAYNKPEGVESTQDARNPRNIDLAMNYQGPRVFLIGRLDIASEGLILLTNDGDLVNPILRAEGQHEKEYVVVFDKSVSDRDIAQMEAGLDIGDEERGPTRPCRVERLGGNRIKIILTEGRNRQIRRMAEALGLRVVRLKRIRVMNVELGDLKTGAWRYLSKEEEAELLKRISAS
jgi:23S rRNA pseudouridine2604 synthase